MLNAILPEDIRILAC